MRKKAPIKNRFGYRMTCTVITRVVEMGLDEIFGLTAGVCFMFIMIIVVSKWMSIYASTTSLIGYYHACFIKLFQGRRP